ncbi:MAG: nucleotidyltransferase domain-containing protein [Ardenticatenaceae bacterium]|nr:nucleotidyltransferase domain-containing protein [Ardenticatenaceae bacterium]
MSIQTAVLKPDTRLQTRQITPELIKYIIKKIVDEISPRQIILFGSYAREHTTDASDLDLFIVHDSPVSNREVRRRIEYLLRGRYFDLDLIVRTSREVTRNLADGNPFYTRHIFGEGKVLYDRPA